MYHDRDFKEGTRYTNIQLRAILPKKKKGRKTVLHTKGL